MPIPGIRLPGIRQGLLRSHGRTSSRAARRSRPRAADHETRCPRGSRGRQPSPARVSDGRSPAAAPATRVATFLGRLLPGAAELRHYHLQWLRPDLLAGLAVWAVLVPQGLAYGELAGLSPVTGLYTALGALVLYALFGSSRYLHVGPESSVAIVTASYVGGLVTGDPERAAALASLLALVTAGFLLAGAALRLGVVARLLSTPVLAGYLTGSAVVIAASQLGKVLAIPTTGDTWWQKVAEVATHLPDTNTYALAVGVGSLVIVL